MNFFRKKDERTTREAHASGIDRALDSINTRITILESDQAAIKQELADCYSIRRAYLAAERALDPRYQLSYNEGGSSEALDLTLVEQELLPTVTEKEDD